MAGITSRLFRLKSDQRGTSMIEFALVSPFLVVLVLGIGDFGMGFSAQYALQQAANRALESAHLGESNGNYDYLIAEAAAAANVPAANVDLDQWIECNGAVEPDGVCEPAQQTARYLRLTIVSSFNPTFDKFHGSNVLADGTIPLSADASVRVR